MQIGAQKIPRRMNIFVQSTEADENNVKKYKSIKEKSESFDVFCSIYRHKWRQICSTNKHTFFYFKSVNLSSNVGHKTSYTYHFTLKNKKTFVRTEN